MGCDIHAFVEYQPYEESWMLMATLHLPRNYTLFTAMAGVRDKGTGIEQYPPKGLPTDIGIMTNSHYQEGREDWHTPSWLDLDELAIAYDRYTLFDLHRIPEMDGIIASMRTLEGFGKKTRLVFWFDN